MKSKLFFLRNRRGFTPYCVYIYKGARVTTKNQETKKEMKNKKNYKAEFNH
jgi:hypothetical protein